MSKLTVYEDDTHAWRLIEGDALELLAKLPENSVDAVVTDPPYGIGMQPWDGTDIRRAAGSEARTANEAFQRWTTLWARQIRRVLAPGGHALIFAAPRTFHRLAVGVEDAGLEIRDQLLWVNGQGIPKSRRYPGGRATTLKPAYEPILIARAPLDGSTQTNLDRWSTGALNVDAAAVGPQRYWPANLALSHAPDCEEAACTNLCPAAALDAANPKTAPSRIFYCSKASRAEREAGCEGLPPREVALYTGKRQTPRRRDNHHPTVKPIELMRWLVRLVVPAGGLVLDLFAGSGSTGAAAILEDRPFVGIEREPDYVEIACARLTHWAHQGEHTP